MRSLIFFTHVSVYFLLAVQRFHIRSDFAVAKLLISVNCNSRRMPYTRNPLISNHVCGPFDDVSPLQKSWLNYSFRTVVRFSFREKTNVERGYIAYNFSSRSRSSAAGLNPISVEFSVVIMPTSIRLLELCLELNFMPRFMSCGRDLSSDDASCRLRKSNLPIIHLWHN
jgi:hypothetical protein